MARTRTGTVEYVAARKGEAQGHYRARVTMWDGSRTPWLPLDPSPKSAQAEKRARETAAAWTEQAEAQGLGWVPPSPRTGAAVHAARPAADMAGWLDKWTADREARGYTSTGQDRARHRRYIAPAVEDKHIREWTPDDLRGLSHDLDKRVQAGELAWRTALHVWSLATKMCSDAAESKRDDLRCRTDNPSAGVRGPDAGSERGKQFLYPSEVLRFVTCQDVPLRWRRIVAVAVCTYMRDAELRALECEDVDLEHDTIAVNKAQSRRSSAVKATKGRRRRHLPIEPAVAPLLAALTREAGEHGPILPTFDRDMARGLRRWLVIAGVKRRELHEQTPTSVPITFHDLRATGITWMAVRGDDHLKIMQRAGHEDFETTQRYIRLAEQLREGFGDVFPALPAELLGEAPRAPIVQANRPERRKYVELQGGDRVG